jgi:septal ring factor EnvC (AmiA/AmiB activator)
MPWPATDSMVARAKEKAAARAEDEERWRANRVGDGQRKNGGAGHDNLMGNTMEGMRRGRGDGPVTGIHATGHENGVALIPCRHRLRAGQK